MPREQQGRASCLLYDGDLDVVIVYHSLANRISLILVSLEFAIGWWCGHNLWLILVWSLSWRRAESCIQSGSCDLHNKCCNVVIIISRGCQSRCNRCRTAGEVVICYAAFLPTAWITATRHPGVKVG